MSKIKSKWDNLDKSIQKWATRVGAIVTIIGALTAGGSWLVNQIDNNLASRIEEQTSQMQSEIQKMAEKADEQDAQTELQLTRLELMMLMETNPYNIVEIEKVAHHYFQDLKGNYYMTSEYSDWCKKYGGDCDIILK